jgi:CHAD domain-containing protein
MADGMMAMDPDPDWKAMKKAGKPVFQRLGALRDVQVMMEWIEKLELHLPRATSEQHLLSNPVATENPAPVSDVGAKTAEPDPHDPAAQTLLHILKAREQEHKHEARAALEEFNRKQWRQWSTSLPARAARIRPGNAVFKHLALERWTAARDLHTRAMRNRSQVTLHTLRIGIKRFRYIVENFLPVEHEAWSDDLKHMQDLLGEVHDLDVLWGTALSCHVFPDEASRRAWHARIVEERTKRIDEYREKTTGPDSLWSVWRNGLPQGEQVREFATRRMKLWAKALDPDFAHSERVARLSLQLYDGLLAGGLLRPFTAGPATATNGKDSPARTSLYAAALLHDVGKAKGHKGHHKESLELIKKHGTPLGWKEEDIRRAGLVARFHVGALPQRHKVMRDLLPDEQRTVVRLASILRLANAMDAVHDGHVRRLKIENVVAPSKNRRTSGFLRKPPALGKNEALVIAADGYADGTATARAVAAERYLLETVLRRPVVVRPAPNGERQPNRARPRMK